MEDATDRQMNREGNDASQLFFRILIGHVVVRPPGKGQFLRTRRSRFSEDSIVSLSLLRLINTLDRRARKTAAAVLVRQVKPLPASPLAKFRGLTLDVHQTDF